MKLLLSYLKRRGWTLLYFAAAAGVFAGVFRLYGLPAEAVGYASLLCLVPGLVLLALIWLIRFLRRHRRKRAKPPKVEKLKRKYLR